MNAELEVAVHWSKDVPHLVPGKGIKFAVIDQYTGNRSSTWRVWTSKNHDDVYLLEVKTGPRWKASHHNDGHVWRIAMTREGAAQLGREREVVDHWDSRPTPQGWREGVGVLVPLAYLRPQPESLAPSVRQVPTSPAHSAIAVRLLFEEPGAAGAKLPAAFPVAVLDRFNGGRVYVIATPEALTARAHDALAEMCANASRSREDNGADEDWPRFVGVFAMNEQRVLADLTIG